MKDEELPLSITTLDNGTTQFYIASHGITYLKEYETPAFYDVVKPIYSPQKTRYSKKITFGSIKILFINKSLAY
jgi:hypothetical protein